jgi:hypothetical protein
MARPQQCRTISPAALRLGHRCNWRGLMRGQGENRLGLFLCRTPLTAASPAPFAPEIKARAREALAARMGIGHS